MVNVDGFRPDDAIGWKNEERWCDSNAWASYKHGGDEGVVP